MSKELADRLDKIKECLDFFCRRCNEQGFYSPPLQPIVKEAYEAIAALRSLTAPTNTPNGDRQELIDKCLDAGRDEGIEAAAKHFESLPHQEWWNPQIVDTIRALKGGK